MLLPHQFKNAFYKKWLEFCGVFTAFLGALLLAGLFLHKKSDAGFFTATTFETNNFVISYASSIFLQILGVTAFGIVAVFIAAVAYFVYFKQISKAIIYKGLLFSFAASFLFATTPFFCVLEYQGITNHIFKLLFEMMPVWGKITTQCFLSMAMLYCALSSGNIFSIIKLPMPKFNLRMPCFKIKMPKVNVAMPSFKKEAKRTEKQIPIMLKGGMPSAKPQFENYQEEVFDDSIEDIEPITPIVKKEEYKKPYQEPPKKVFDKNFVLPPLQLLTQNTKRGNYQNPRLLEEEAKKLHKVLMEFSVKGEIERIHAGPVVTRYDFIPAAGIKTARVISLSDDIARSMSAVSARISVVKGENAIGIELPNKNRQSVYLRELLEAKEYTTAQGKLNLALGQDILGNSVVADLAKMPHLLIAGTTGSGKSVGINTMILSLLYKLTPKECRLVMIDPKMLELSIYQDIPHLLTPVVTEPKKAVAALKWAVREMEMRYAKMAKLGVRNIENYNQRIEQIRQSGNVPKVQTGYDASTGEPRYEAQAIDMESLPFIVVVVDEMADLMMVAGKEIETCVQRLAQMARAAGIHLIMATQRPSVDVITGTIKANFPTRISFNVTSKIDSRTILGEQGAESLLGQGDMLYMAGGGKIIRVHGPFVSDEEVMSIVSHLKSQAPPDYKLEFHVDEDDGNGESFGGDDENDPMYRDAVNLVMSEKKVSVSFLQRRMSIGYNRAARIVDRMEEQGVVSAANATGRRDILVS